MPLALDTPVRPTALVVRSYREGWTPGRDPRWLDRALLVGVVLSLVWTAWLVLVADDARGDAGQVTYGCVAETVEQASAFAVVMGDGRPVDRQFAEDACRTRWSRP